MDAIFNICSNICTLSCCGDIRNAAEKLLPCIFRSEEPEPPLIHEEKKKIKFFGRTVVELNPIGENYISRLIYVKKRTCGYEAI